VKEKNRIIVDTLSVPNQPKAIDGTLDSDVFSLSPTDRIRCVAPLVYSLRASFVGDGYLLEGEVSTVINCNCDRCLKDYEIKVVVPDVCHFYEGVTERQLDVTDDVREDVVINFPEKCLCSDECLGICPQCGKNLNEEPCDCPDSQKKQGTWDGLDKLEL